MTQEHTGTIQADTHTLGSAHPAGGTLHPPQPSAGNPRSRSRWYANATKSPPNWYQVMRAKTGLSTTQLRRLRMLSHGVVVTHNDFGITLKDSWHYISTLRRKVPWLTVRRLIGVGYIIPEEELARLRSFLCLEEL